MSKKYSRQISKLPDNQTRPFTSTKSLIDLQFGKRMPLNKAEKTYLDQVNKMKEKLSWLESRNCGINQRVGGRRRKKGIILLSSVG